MHIVIIDDEPNIRTALRDILEDEGYEVSEAGDGENGLRLLDVSPADIVLLDVKLPKRDGMAILGDIKSRMPKTEVVMISGHSDIETAVGALRKGAYDFLEKPLSLPKVRVVVAHAAEKITLWRRTQEQTDARFKPLIGSGAAMNAVRSTIARVAPTNASVLVRGESGTGKELAAQQIHAQSNVAAGAYVQVNCAAIPHDLIESELFGHEKGAFTGAAARRLGKFEQANEGTLFLDEIGDMDIAVQAKVLRALQNGEFQRVGGSETLFAKVRVVAATNKDLEKEVEAGRFREDLFFRLNVVPIFMPPLREHPEDVADLARHFLAAFCMENGREAIHITDEALGKLKTFSFRGNVRELKNLVERLAIFSVGNEIGLSDVLAQSHPVLTGQNMHFLRSRPLSDAKNELEKTFIETQLNLYGWDIVRTATALDILPNNLHRKITQLGIERPHRKPGSPENGGTVEEQQEKDD
jgi:two-component system nitrogen regulation response regulator NtrX